MSVEMINWWGERMSEIVPALFWQSSLVILVVWTIDFVLRRRLRAAVRYALWMVVLLKLVLPPTFAFPTGAGWWLYSKTVAVSQTRPATVSYRIAPAMVTDLRPVPGPQTPAKPRLSFFGWLLLTGAAAALILAAYLIFRWKRFVRKVRLSAPASDFINQICTESCQRVGIKRVPEIRLTTLSVSPCVFGLFRPVILLPEALVEELAENQLRTVLIHELVHLKRCDIWVNSFQVLLQIVYWWNPLVWFANAQIRRVREEAVDDAVVACLAENSDEYAPTLLQVARLSLSSPLASLGLVGILEIRSALARRIERLVKLSAPKKAGLTLLSLFAVSLFAAVILPMGKSPPKTGNQAKIRSKIVRNSEFHGEMGKYMPPSNSEKRTNGMEAFNDKNSLPKNALLMATQKWQVDPSIFVQNAMKSVSSKKSQILIEARFIEIAEFNPAGEPSDSPLNIIPVDASTNCESIKATAFSVLEKSLPCTTNVQLTADGNPTVTKILDNDQAKALVSRLEARASTDILTAPKVTTLDGRQTHISVQDIMTLIYGVDASLEKGISYCCAPMPIGPTLDVVPSLSETNGTINLNVVSTLIRFDGYVEPKPYGEICEKGAKPLRYALPLPQIQFQQLASQASVTEGQTLMLAGPVSYQTVKNVRKVAVLSDLPFVGGWFRKETTTKVKKHLIVMVTPTIIDVTGKQQHWAKKYL